MADDFEVVIEWDDPQFKQALEDPQGFVPHLALAMKDITEGFQDQASVYAPESEANAPGRVDQDGHPIGFYERGRGWWYPVMNRSTLGKGAMGTVRPNLKAPTTFRRRAMLAAGFPGVIGYKLRPTSEQMHDQWSNEVSVEQDGVTGRVTNEASYSDDVVGLGQTALHQSRGWTNVELVWNSQDMQNLVDEVTLRALNDYYNLKD
jgi:hypothetical protein